MGLFDNIQNLLESKNKDGIEDCIKVDSYSDLVQAIENDIKNICLKSDIFFEREITLEGNDFTFNGNGHTLDAKGSGRFFTINGNNIKFKFITFKNGFSQKDYGRSPIRGWSEKTVEYRGGAIYNNGTCSFFNCDFINNTIGDKKWYTQSRGNSHLNYIPKGVAIYSSGDCFTYSCYYKGNLDKGGITGANYGVTVKKEDVKFPNNPLFEDEINEFEEDEILEDDYYEDLWPEHDDNTKNDELNNVPESSDKIRDFEYLNDLINSGVHEIVLDSDIVLDENKSYDNDGIRLNVDNLIIDGNHHTIDACGKSRIFNIGNNKNIIIKSLTFKNGFKTDPGKVVYDELVSKSYGGAIHTAGECIFLDCNFIGNKVGNSYITLSPRVEYVAKGAAIYGTKDSMSRLFSCSFKDNEELMNHYSNDISGEYLEMNCDWSIDCAYYLLKRVFYRYLDIIKTSLDISNEESLDEKIHKSIDDGILKITLDKDYSTDHIINLNVDNLEIDGNNHKISGGNLSGIFSCSGKNVTIKNMVIENTKGAIFNCGNLKLVNIKFADNFSKNKGGTIYNQGHLEVKRCRFENNLSRFKGSAIYNVGNIVVSNSQFSKNISMISTITNKGYLEMYRSIFAENLSKHIISNEDNGKSYLSKCEFTDNTTILATIQNDGIFLSVDNIIFAGNLFKQNASIVISNNSRMNLNGFACDDSARIFNRGELYLKCDIGDIIDNQGLISKVTYDDDNFDFTYLDQKIHESKSTEITLDHDISFEDYEIDYYEGGIELDIDDLTIDGCGKVIDARGLSRIFIITSKNVTLKNIVFKNGRSFSDFMNPLNECGGALRINSNAKVSIENCRFVNNVSENNGGAIHQKGHLMIIKSSFSKNKASNMGGAIHRNYPKLDIMESRFIANKAKYGGAVYVDEGTLYVSESKLNKNAARYGGAIFNRNGGILKVSSSWFNENLADQGGAIDNRRGELSIDDCEMIANEAKICGGAIHQSFGKLSLSNSILNNNKAVKYKNMSTFAQKGGDFSYTDLEWDYKFHPTSRRSFF